MQMLEIINECKSVVFTGHSLGGPLASLSALWLLSAKQTGSPSIEVLCVTYGSPMLGNRSFSQAILQERWAGNFCHIVAQHDLVPRLLFAPAFEEMRAIIQFWQLSMASNHSIQLAFVLSDEIKCEIFEKVLACVEDTLIGGEGRETSSFWPFGSYMFCTENGAICLDNGMAIVNLLHLMLAKGSADASIQDHLKYESYVAQVCWRYLQRKSLTNACFSESSNEAGIALALQSSGLTFQVTKICIATQKLEGFFKLYTIYRP